MGSPAKKDDTKSFLRWHDPHQVKGSKRGASSQPGIRLPCSLPSMVHPWRRVVKGCLLFCRRGGIVVANKGGLFYNCFNSPIVRPLSNLTQRDNHKYKL